MVIRLYENNYYRIKGEDKKIDRHHVINVAHGGLSEAGNLQLLCSGHHRMKHQSPDEPLG